MRFMTTKTATAALIAGAALTLAGCGKSTSTDTVDNTTLTEMNDTGTIEGTTNDAGAMDVPTETNTAVDANLAADNTVSPSNSGAEAGNSM